MKSKWHGILVIILLSSYINVQGQIQDSTSADSLGRKPTITLSDIDTIALTMDRVSSGTISGVSSIPELINAILDGEASNKLVFSLGTRLLPGTAAEVQFRYIDASPSRDSLITTLDIPAIKTPLAYNLGYEIEYRNIYGRIGVNGFFGAFSSYSPYLSVGLILADSTRKNQLSVGGQLQYGFGKYKLGEVQNNSIYFQVGTVQIYDQSLVMIYRDDFISLAPVINLSKDLQKIGSGRMELWLHAALNLTVRYDTKVEFYGGDGLLPILINTEPDATLPLSDVDVTFIKDEALIDKLPIYYLGPEIGIGIKYKLF